MIVRSIAVSSVEPDPDQPRRTIDPNELKQLADSIRRTRQLQPIIVFEVDGRFHLADGHRRTAAMSAIGVESIEAIVLPERPAPDQLLLIQMTANCQRSDLSPTELANAMQRLKDLKGWSNTEVAQNLSLSKAKVTQVLSYLQLPKEIQTLLDDGKLAGSTAYAISRAKDSQTQQQMLREVLSGKLKRDDASRRVGRKAPTAKRSVRSSFQLPHGSVVFDTDAHPTLDDCIAVSKSLIAECRKAARQGIDVSTLQQVLKDQHATRN